MPIESKQYHHARCATLVKKRHFQSILESHSAVQFFFTKGKWGKALSTVVRRRLENRDLEVTSNSFNLYGRDQNEDFHILFELVETTIGNEVIQDFRAPYTSIDVKNFQELTGRVRGVKRQLQTVQAERVKESRYSKRWREAQADKWAKNNECWQYNNNRWEKQKTLNSAWGTAHKDLVKGIAEVLLFFCNTG